MGPPSFSLLTYSLYQEIPAAKTHAYLLGEASRIRTLFSLSEALTRSTPYPV